MAYNQIDEIVIENFIIAYPNIEHLYEDFKKNFILILKECFGNKKVSDFRYIGLGSGHINWTQNQYDCDPRFDELVTALIVESMIGEDDGQEINRKQIDYLKDCLNIGLNIGKDIIPLIKWKVNCWLIDEQKKYNPVGYNVRMNIHAQVEKFESEGILNTTRSKKNPKKILSIKLISNPVSKVLDFIHLKNLIDEFDQKEIAKVGICVGVKGQKVVNQIFQKLIDGGWGQVEFDIMKDVVDEVSTGVIKTNSNPERGKHVVKVNGVFVPFIDRRIDCSGDNDDKVRILNIINDCITNKINAKPQQTKDKLFKMLKAFKNLVKKQKNSKINGSELAKKLKLEPNSTFYDRFAHLQRIFKECEQVYIYTLEKKV